MRLGICARVEAAALVKAAGADFIEENIQSLFQGKLEESQWQGPARLHDCPLSVPAANSLVPGDLKIVGNHVDPDALRRYMTNVVDRAAKTGTRILVFGSAAARNVPEGFDRAKAKTQIFDFLRMAAPLAATHGITLVAEPLNRKESNIINTVDEAMGYVKQVNHPNFLCLVDSYHFWIENDSLDDLRAAMPSIAHVHIADRDGRVPPGQSGTADYKPFFAVLKEAGYDAMVSIESPGFNDYTNLAPRVISHVRDQWQRA